MKTAFAGEGLTTFKTNCNMNDMNTFFDDSLEMDVEEMDPNDDPFEDLIGNLFSEDTEQASQQAAEDMNEYDDGLDSEYNESPYEIEE